MGEIGRRFAGARRPRRWQRSCYHRWGCTHAVDRFSGTRSGAALQHVGLPEGCRSGNCPACRRGTSRFRERHRCGVGERGRRLRYRRLSRRPAGLTDLVRLDRREERRRGAHAVARLGLRQSQGRGGKSGVITMPSQAASSEATGVATMLATERFADPLTEKLAAFVRGLGIEVRAATLSEKTFLPGLEIRDGAILIDETRLAYPGDILHEAGHLAVADPAERNAPTLSPSDADEVTTIAWS